jgi:hypothetical protein
MSDVTHWWDELDEDESGFLEANEIRNLLLRMNQPVDKKSFMKTVKEFLAVGRVLQLEEYTKQTRTREQEREKKNEKETQRRPLQRGKSMKSGVRAIELLSTLANNDAEIEVDMDTLAVTKEQFNRWYFRKCAMLVQSPYDVLFGTTRCAPCL